MTIRTGSDSSEHPIYLLIRRYFRILSHYDEQRSARLEQIVKFQKQPWQSHHQLCVRCFIMRDDSESECSPLGYGQTSKYKCAFFAGTIWELQKSTMTIFAAETVGMGVLIFIGCMGCIGTGPAPPPPMQTALTFGLTVNLIIMVG